MVFAGCTLDELYSNDGGGDVAEVPEDPEESETPDDDVENPDNNEEPDTPFEDVESVLLRGEVIGSRYSVDYNTSNKSESVNTKESVFDGAVYEVVVFGGEVYFVCVEEAEVAWAHFLPGL